MRWEGVGVLEVSISLIPPSFCEPQESHIRNLAGCEQVVGENGDLLSRGSPIENIHLVLISLIEQYRACEYTCDGQG